MIAGFAERLVEWLIFDWLIFDGFAGFCVSWLFVEVGSLVSPLVSQTVKLRWLVWFGWFGLVGWSVG